MGRIACTTSAIGVRYSAPSHTLREYLRASMSAPPELRSTVTGVLQHWFTQQGFSQARFERGRSRIANGSGDGMIVFRLRQRPGHTTWFRSTAQGGLIVFEVAVDGEGVRYTGYCPLLLFGIWERKLPFKADAGRLFANRAEGWRVAQALQAELRKMRVEGLP